MPCCVILVLSQRARAVVTEAAAKLSLKLHELVRDRSPVHLAHTVVSRNLDMLDSSIPGTQDGAAPEALVSNRGKAKDGPKAMTLSDMSKHATLSLKHFTAQDVLISLFEWALENLRNRRLMHLLSNHSSWRWDGNADISSPEGSKSIL